jgi:YbbR domain-containing protein
MNVLKRLGGIVTNNFGLKLLSVGLAFVLWVIVAQISNPVGTVTFNNVEVTLLNADLLESQGKVYQVLDQTNIVKVTVRAPESVISTLSASDISAVADLSEISEDGTVPITYSLDRAERIIADHDELLVTVDDKKTKYINIQYQLIGSVGEGCVQGQVKLDRNRLEVSGPASAVDRISYALVTIDLDGAVKTISADMELVLCDETGVRIENEMIVKQTDYVTTTVTVLSTKTVPIYASVTGEPAIGYIYTGDIEVSPEVITIAGDTSVLNGIAAITITDPVDIGSARNDITATYDLSKYLPGGVEFEDKTFDGEVAVTAYVEKMLEKNLTISTDSLLIHDVPEGFEAEIVAADEINVRLVGLGTELNAVSSESLTGIIEIHSYLTANNITDIHDGDIIAIPVKFNLSEHVNADAIFVRIQLTQTADV